jgi:uncharacterized protein
MTVDGSGEPDPLVLQSTRIVLRPLANSLPLGFLALGGGTLVLAGLQLGWLDPTQGHAVALILLGFVFPLQLVAAVLGFLSRDVVAGTGMGILAATWLAVALVTVTAAPGSTSAALGLLLIFSAGALLVPAVVATSGKVVPVVVLLTTSLRFLTSGIYELGVGAGVGMKETSGVVGLVLCAVAFYAALAMAIEDSQRRTILPLLRRGRGKESLAGNLRDQLRRLEGEAGVREQL